MIKNTENYKIKISYLTNGVLHLILSNLPAPAPNEAHKDSQKKVI